MSKKKTLYGTVTQRREVEYKPVRRSCADCGQAEYNIWYEMTSSGWVCDKCMDKRWAQRAEEMKQEEDGDGK